MDRAIARESESIDGSSTASSVTLRMRSSSCGGREVNPTGGQDENCSLHAFARHVELDAFRGQGIR